MTELQQHQTDAFEAYKAAKIRADETLDIVDAAEAGRAWWRFLQAFNEVEPAAQGSVCKFAKPKLDRGGAA
jgi:hypothetical protein